ncbi:hypothetical protein U5801_24390 [Lamprobacter modestohalophilus]|uniref:beta strand repeat-containing protein n=1 Tax=Lamprobacter modestohalophilus TaxID=1064514 RepID=UPI002ADEC078|nr:hypothetical protein [Lamprobacter modestohalophilus]MEA1052922.1 hypothetical protein [Lamprobacter modestohalophilus]
MTDGIGLFNNVTARFYLKDAPSTGAADNTFAYGPANSGWTPLAGDWNADGTDTIALYNATAGRFYLRNENSNGNADTTFNYGPAGSDWVPIVGDWDGDGTDTIGLYNATLGRFYLRNDNNNGVADLAFNYGPASSSWVPIVGDWDGDGTDTIGLYDATAGRFYLRNENANGVADLAFNYGAVDAGWMPVAGDWDNDGTDTIGLFDAAAGRFLLRNSNDNGIADINARYGPTNTDWMPLVGNWTQAGPETYTLTDALPLYQADALPSPYEIDPTSVLDAGSVTGAAAASTLTDVEAIIAGAANSESLVLADLFVWAVADTADNLFAGDDVEPTLVDALGGASAVTVTTEVTTAQQTALNAINDNVTYEGGVVGETFTLTADVNEFTGTASDDQFDGPLTVASRETLNTFDILDGGEGIDTLTATLNADGTPIETSLTSIENIFIRSVTGANVLDLANATGYEQLWSNVSQQDVYFANVAEQVIAGARNISDTAAGNYIEVEYVAGTVANTATQAIVLENANVELNLTQAGAAMTVRNVSLASNGTANVAAFDTDLIDTATIQSLTITGAGNLVLEAEDITAGTVDASAATGSVSLSLDDAAPTNLATGVTLRTVTMGEGDDTVDASNATLADNEIEAGSGEDTIVVDGTSATLTDDLVSNVSGFEVLSLNDLDQTISAATMRSLGFDGLIVTDAVAGAEISNLTADNSLTLVDADAGNTADVITLAVTGAAVDDDASLSFTVLGDDGSNSSYDVTIADVEHITVTTVDADVDVFQASALALTSAELETLTLLGDEAVMFDGTGNAALASVDASALAVADAGTGDLTAEISVGDGVTVIGSAGDDSIAFLEMGEITGGAGEDLFVVGAVAAPTTNVPRFSTITDLNASEDDSIDMGGAVTLSTDGAGTDVNLIEEADLGLAPGVTATFVDYVAAAAVAGDATLSGFVFEGTTYLQFNALDAATDYDAAADFFVALTGTVDLTAFTYA